MEQETKNQRPKAQTLADFVSEEKLLQVLGIEKNALRRLCATKGLPVIRLGDKVRLFSIPSLVEWLTSQER